MESNIANETKAAIKDPVTAIPFASQQLPRQRPVSAVSSKPTLYLAVPDSAIGVIYPTIYPINHDYPPNAHRIGTAIQSAKQTIHATHYINAGEEITISDHKDASPETPNARI